MRNLTNHPADEFSFSSEASVTNIPINADIQYPLSPLQEGMLIHSLAEKGVGMYVSQGVHLFNAINIEAIQKKVAVLK